MGAKLVGNLKGMEKRALTPDLAVGSLKPGVLAVAGTKKDAGGSLVDRIGARGEVASGVHCDESGSPESARPDERHDHCFAIGLAITLLLVRKTQDVILAERPSLVHHAARRQKSDFPFEAMPLGDPTSQFGGVVHRRRIVLGCESGPR